MSEHDSARIGLPYLEAGQMQKHVTLNETLTRLDALVQAQIQSATVAAEPADPPDGVLYLIPAGSVGETWSGLSAGTLVRAEQGAWSVVQAPLGMIAYVADTLQLIVKGDEGWGSAGDCLRTLQQVERLGFGGRVDFALTDDDHFEMRVSTDGDDWVSAMTVDSGTGLATFARGAQRRVVTVMSASGVYAPPSWARTIEIIAVGGGGGGGAGFFGASGSRFGGGGGGAGGVSRGVWGGGGGRIQHLDRGRLWRYCGSRKFRHRGKRFGGLCGRHIDPNRAWGRRRRSRFFHGRRGGGGRGRCTELQWRGRIERRCEWRGREEF